MPGFRYDQFCPVARAAEILGERWTMLILRDLSCGPQRFSDLRRRLPGLSSSVLSQRLERLEALGLVTRDALPPPTPASLYRLTDEGEALRPVLHALIRFGVRHLGPPRAGDHLEPEWVPVGMEAFARRGRVPRRSIDVRIPDGDGEVAVRVVGGRGGTRILRDANGKGPADATLRAAPLVLLGVMSGGLPVSEAAASGAAEVSGDPDALADLPALFDVVDLIARPS